MLSFSTIMVGEKITTYTNRFLNYELYDSLVYSGKITFLKFALQQPLQNIYQKIKNHNHSKIHIRIAR